MNRILVQLSTSLLDIDRCRCRCALAQDTLPYKGRHGGGRRPRCARSRASSTNISAISHGPYSRMMDEREETGHPHRLLVLRRAAKSPDQPDLYIVETYPNMAVFDTISEKMTA